MSLQIILTAMGDFTDVAVKQAIAEARNEKIAEMTDENEKRTKEAFESSMGAMRASYMMISGFAQAIGGSMGQIFSSMYSVAVSAIGTYKAIAAAMAASGVGTPQAILMTISLVTAISSLTSVMMGQKELSRRISALNMSLHGISQMIGVLNF